MLIIQKIEQIAISSKGSKREIANFILQNSRDLSAYTVDSIAEKTFTSKASVVRFAKILGFLGWRKFLVDFTKEQNYLNQHQGEVDANFPFAKTDTIAKVISNIQKLEKQTLDTTSYLLEDKSLIQATNIIVNAKNTVLYAESPNNYLAELFKRKLLSIGKRAIVVKDDEAGLEAGALTNADCAVIVSYSGNSNSRAIRHINLLKAHHIPVIGITSDTKNYLREKADVSLLIATEENLYTKIASFQTEISIESIFNILFALIFQKNYDANQYYHLDSARYLELERKNNDLNS